MNETLKTHLIAKKKSAKVLLIRFSSFGDITQCLSVPTRLKELAESTQIQWVTSSEFVGLIESHPAVDQVWSLNRKMGIKALLSLIPQLRNENFTHIYDAHNNLRSWILTLGLRHLRWHQPQILRKPKKHLKRFLLFRLRINRYRQPLSGQRDLLEALTAWGLSESLPPAPQMFIPATCKIPEQLSVWLREKNKTDFIALAASAAYPLKRWPIDHWKKLITTQNNKLFVLLGGPKDEFLTQLQEIAPERVLNLAGHLTLLQSSAVIQASSLLIANDTGLLHVAEQLGKNCIALMGPAPFGFPSRPTTKILEIQLACRPCSKHGQGPCTNRQFQKCMTDITPEQVAHHALGLEVAQ